MNVRNVLLLLAVVGLSGCNGLRGMLARKPTRRVLPPDATAEQIVTELNRNVLGDGVRPGLASWRSDHVRVSMTHVPGSVSANLAVAAPRSFRLQVAAPFGGQMADLGSNGDEYWMWSKEADPEAVLVGHHDCPVDPRLGVQMPFEPEWLLEVLGVVPMASDGVHVTGDGDVAELSSTVRLSTGKSVRKIKKVSLITGEILRHEVRGLSGATIAVAEVKQSYKCPRTGLLLPQDVRIRWPDFGQGMTIKIAGHQPNPQHLTASTFQRPRNPTWRVVAMTQEPPGVAPVSHRTAAEPAEPNPFQ